MRSKILESEREPVHGGVYAIKNTANRRMYIGAAAIFMQRWRAHKALLRNGNHHNANLQLDWNVFGEGVFSFEILEQVDNLQILPEREIYWIAQYAGTPVYNATTASRGLKANVSVRANLDIDEQAREDAQQIAKEYGLGSVSAAVRFALREVAKQVQQKDKKGDQPSDR